MKQVSQNAILIMLFTNTNTTYLIILAYLNSLNLNIPVCFVAVGHAALQAFFLRRLVNKRILQGRMRKCSSLSPFF